MSGIACFEIAVDLFDPSGEWHPNTRVRSFACPSDYGICTCEEIVRTRLRAGKWFETFIQRILCLSSSALGEALMTIVEPSKGQNRLCTLEQQERILSSLKQMCECDRRPHSSGESATGTAMDKLDNLVDTSFMLGREFSSHSNIRPVEMSFNQILRPTPSVLRLTSLRDSRNLKHKINSTIKKVIAANIRANSDDDRPGFIYIMQRDTVTDHVKIGFSKKNAAIRHDTLRKCFDDLRIVAHTTRVPHASKVERLVHAELMYHRRWQDCARCGKQHQE